MMLFELLSSTKDQPRVKDNFEEFMRLQKMYKEVILKIFAERATMRMSQQREFFKIMSWD
jgi:hypothetical protein